MHGTTTSERLRVHARTLAPRVAALVLGLHACSYNPRPVDGQLQCGPSLECPTGYSCQKAAGSFTCWNVKGPGPQLPDSGADAPIDTSAKDLHISEKPAGTGGSDGTGGVTGSGGASASGGMPGTGGVSTSGGAPGTGGASASGGRAGTG